MYHIIKCIYLHVYAYVYACMRACVYVCVCVFVCVCVCVCMCVYTLTHKHRCHRKNSQSHPPLSLKKKNTGVTDRIQKVTHRYLSEQYPQGWACVCVCVCV